MNMKSPLAAFIVGLCLAAAFAQAVTVPTFIGRTVIIGSGTTAQRPAASSTYLGALYVNTDDTTCDVAGVGSLEYSNGATWRPICATDGGVASGPQFWRDAGSGNIQADAVTVILGDAGSGVNALWVQNTGGRVFLGPDGTTTSYITGDGTNVYSPGAIADTMPRSFSTQLAPAGALTAGTIIGGDFAPISSVTPMPTVRIHQIAMNASVAGSGGTTDMVFRINYDAQNCDCTAQCNIGTGPFSLLCANTADCTFDFNAGTGIISYTVPSIGDCAVGATLTGTIDYRAQYNANGTLYP